MNAARRSLPATGAGNSKGSSKKLRGMKFEDFLQSQVLPDKSTTKKPEAGAPGGKRSSVKNTEAKGPSYASSIVSKSSKLTGVKLPSAPQSNKVAENKAAKSDVKEDVKELVQILQEVKDEKKQVDLELPT